MSRVRSCLALVVTLTMLLSSTAMARVLVECRMSGRIGSECCCHHAEPPSDEASGLDAAPALEKPGCCEPKGGDFRLPDATTGSADVDTMLALAPVASALDLLVPPAARSVAVPAQARAPPAVGPPLYVRHCAWLN